MLDVAMESNLGTCLGEIMNENPHTTFTTYDLLQNLTECSLSTVDCKEFMQFWLFDSEVPILNISVDSDSFQSGHITSIRLSYAIMCPLDKIQSDSCPQKNPAKNSTSHPLFALDLYDIRGNEIMPMIFYHGKNVETFQVSIDTFLFLGNIRSKGNFLIQYPHRTYFEFMQWCLENWRLNSSQSTLSKVSSRLDPKPLLFYIYDMFELSRRNVINMEWLVTILYWLGNAQAVKATELETLVEFKDLCIGYDLLVYLSKGNFTKGEKDVLVEFLCLDFGSLDKCAYAKRSSLSSKFRFCPHWIPNFAQHFLELLLARKSSVVFKELKILQ